MNVLADFHIHSTLSDGSHTINEIVYLAYKQNIKYISITDHNIAKSYIGINTPYSINFIDGIEISTRYKGYDIHLLGYSKRFNDLKLLNKVLEKIRRGYEKRFYDISNYIFNQFNIKIPKKYIKSKNSIARFCLNCGLEIDEIKKIKVPEEDYFLSTTDAISLIHSQNGKAFFAHPGNLLKKISTDEFYSIIHELAKNGLDGIEVYHYKNTEFQTILVDISNKYNLLISGGSDFHSIIDSQHNLIGDFGLNTESELKRFLDSL